MFKSIDETDKFSYTDCVISDIEKAEDGYIFNVEALIVKENNSQNSNFTESFAGPSKIKFVDGKLAVDFHIIVAYGVSIRTVAENLVDAVRYDLERYTGFEVGKINIYVDGVKVID